ncbi:hypothetical protein K474DRAFT_656570 [Panus rudis PR-1116 ss-1]|nr:hypothetical protein K474DRAFT_656570 [Panus rudis PR-1116 ss-1]
MTCDDSLLAIATGRAKSAFRLYKRGKLEVQNLQRVSLPLPHFLISSFPHFLTSSLPHFLTSSFPHFLISSFPHFLTSSLPHFLISSFPPLIPSHAHFSSASFLPFLSHPVRVGAYGLLFPIQQISIMIIPTVPPQKI